MDFCKFCVFFKYLISVLFVGEVLGVGFCDGIFFSVFFNMCLIELIVWLLFDIVVIVWCNNFLLLFNRVRVKCMGVYCVWLVLVVSFCLVVNVLFVLCVNFFGFMMFLKF